MVLYGVFFQRQSEWCTRQDHSQAVTYTQLSTKSSPGRLYTVQRMNCFPREKRKKKSHVAQPPTHPHVQKHSPGLEVFSAITGIPALTLFPSGGLEPESAQGTCAESPGQCVACGKGHCLCSSPCCRLAVPGSLRLADRQDLR